MPRFRVKGPLIKAPSPPPPSHPVVTHEVVGNASYWKQVRQWFAGNWKSKPVLIIEGPCGVGKTYNVLQLADEYDMDVHGMHSMEKRSAAVVQDAVREASGGSVNGKCKLLFIDDIQLCDKDAVDALVKARTAKTGPMVITCQDYWDRTIRSLHGMTDQLRITLSGIGEKDMLRSVGRSDERALAIAREVNGDYRQFLIRLEEPESCAMDAVHNTRIKSLFDRTEFLMSRSDDMELRSSVFESDPSILSGMLFHNYLSAKGLPERISDYSDLFSETDMRGHCTEEMATVLSNSIHAKEVDVKFVNKGLLERPGNLRKRFKGAEMHDTGTASLLDIPNALEPWFKTKEALGRKRGVVPGGSFF